MKTRDLRKTRTLWCLAMAQGVLLASGVPGAIQAEEARADRADVPAQTGATDNGLLSDVFPGGRPIVVVFRQTSPEAAAWALEPCFPRTEPLDSEIRSATRVDESRLVDPLRFALIPAWVEASALDQTICAHDGPSFSTLIEQATAALDFFEYDKAQALLFRARRALQCGQEIVSSASMAELLFQTGVLYINREGDDRERFEDTLVLEPDRHEPGEYDEKVQKAFARARRDVEKRPLVRIRVTQREVDGLTLRIDGQPAAGDSIVLRSGEHFLQWVNRQNIAVAGSAVLIDATAAQQNNVLPPPELTLISRAEVANQLAQEVRQGALSPKVELALGTLMRRGNHPWILLVVPGEKADTAHALWLRQDNSSNVCKIEPKPDPWSRFGPPLTLTLLAGSAATGGYYVYVYHYLTTTPPEDPELHEAIRKRGYAVGAASIGCLGAALVTGWRTWLYHGDRGGHAAATRVTPRLYVGAGPAGGTIGLAGTW